MTSEKQVEYITKLMQWKGADLDMERVKAMADNEASALIDELKARKSVAKTKVSYLVAPEARRPQAGEWNPIQAGMVKKAVAEHHLLTKGEITDDFAKDCLVAYASFEDADALIKLHYPEVSR